MTVRGRVGRTTAWVVAPLVVALAAAWIWQSEQVTLAASRQEGTQEPAAPAPRAVSGPVRVEVDPAAGSGDAETTAATACEVSVETAAALGPPLSGPRLKAVSSSELVPAYAARLQDGVGVMLSNRSDGPVTFSLEARLPRGVWGLERSAAAGGAPGEPGGLVRVQRLQSVVLGAQTTVRRPGVLEPGEAAVYRFVNYSQRTGASFNSVLSHVRGIRAEEGAEYRRLMAPLSECGSQIARLSRGIKPATRLALLKHVQRALLTVGHAQSLSRNARAMGRISDAGAARAIEGGLDRLEESLTELSAACLGLVPNAKLEPAQGACKVTVSLTNAGSRTLEVAKLGVTTPRGVQVRPAEEAPFRAVQPGQSVHADFVVTVDPDATDLAVIADVSYRSDRAPAHLRLRRAVRALKPLDAP